MDAPEALSTIRGLASAGRYVVTAHAQTRMRQRNVLMKDLRCALMGAVKCVADADKWKVTGPDLDGDDVTVVVEIQRDVIVITVF